MVSLAPPKPLLEAHTEISNLPDLSDAAYFAQVLRLPVEKLESHVDDELAVRARHIGCHAQNLSDKRYTSSAESASTAITYHARTFSTGSNASASTTLTVNSSILYPPRSPKPQSDADEKRQTTGLNFTQYDKYLSQIDKNLDQPKIRKLSVPTDTSAKSVFSVSTRRSFFSVKSGIKNKFRLRRKSIAPFVPTLSCICCRDDFNNKLSLLHNLPCGHTYCVHCLRVMIQQSTNEESKMPPRCCTQPIPSTTVREVLTRDNQQHFLKAVVQFSTPWESRIFCPNASCGEFIPPRHKVDSKHPFNVTCRKCSTRACVMCKRNAHPMGKDCPEDWELEQVLKIGEKSGWKRCYKCRNLVELTQGCTHMTCRCKAQFCYICGGVWDNTVGCPNVCNGEEELERRRLEEEERAAEAEAEKAAQEIAAAADAAERHDALERSRKHATFQILLQAQAEEMKRFTDFASATKDRMKAHHKARKETLVEKQNSEEEKMKERHNKTAGHLEDRQVAAEMELRASLEQSERSVNVRLKHMEAYCEGLGRNPSSQMPHRTVTERDLRELGQQYNLRDNLERLHESKINVMRDRQAKRMEELCDRQDAELEKLLEKRQEELEDLAARFAHETDDLDTLFKSRQERLQQRWELAIEVLCRELEAKEGLEYAKLPTPEWPEEQTTSDEVAIERVKR